MEFTAALAVLWCATTYWLGGQEIPFLEKGLIGIRRYLMPAGLAVFLIWLGAPAWKAILACALLSAGTHLGYKSSILRYALAGAAMAAPSLILGFHWTIVLPVTYHTAYGAISLRDNKFRWAYVGILMGAGIGIAYVTAL